MANQYVFDVETLGIESTAVILSLAVVQFDFEADAEVKYEDLVERAMFIKFDAEEQIKVYKRSITPDSMRWWKEQSDLVKKISLLPNPDIDVSAESGINRLEAYVNERKDGRDYFWARGSLDQVTLDSLTRSVRGINADPIIPYNNWMDIRTAISLLKETAGNGYCQIPGFDRSVVLKHDPVHDVAYDAYMLIKGK